MSAAHSVVHDKMTDRSFLVCGVRLDAFQIDSAVDQIVRWSDEGAGRAVHLCNAYTLSLAVKDADLTALLNRADGNCCDGMPLIWIARRLGLRSMRDRVYGPDLMVATIDRGRARNLKHYLYGSSPEVIEKLGDNLRARFPGVQLVGVESPPFRPLTAEEEDAFVDRVTRSGADIVWVGLGTPRQDVFVDRFRDRVPCVLVAVGAAFDFHAGMKKQAPRVLQRLGLEWLFRLLTEPRRLWKRYLVGNTRFIWAVVKQRPQLTAGRSR